MLPKIKMFICRVGQNALPTGENLQKRELLIPTLCCRCGEPETTLHLLINCPFAREVWSLGPWSHTFDASQVVSFKEALISSGSWIPLPPYGFTINIFPWPELLPRTTQAQEIVSDAETNETYLNLQFTMPSESKLSTTNNYSHTMNEDESISGAGEERQTPEIPDSGSERKLGGVLL
ncbi:hypothetical protein Bca101_097873 [Brassica carinata]